MSQPKFFASHRNYSKTIPNWVLAEIQLPLIEILLRQLPTVSQQKSIAPHRNCSKTIPNFVLAENQLHLIEIVLRLF